MSEDVTQGPAVVAQGSYANMRELQDLLGRRGIVSELLQPPQDKRSS